MSRSKKDKRGGHPVKYRYARWEAIRDGRKKREHIREEILLDEPDSIDMADLFDLMYYEDRWDDYDIWSRDTEESFMEALELRDWQDDYEHTMRRAYNDIDAHNERLYRMEAARPRTCIGCDDFIDEGDICHECSWRMARIQIFRQEEVQV